MKSIHSLKLYFIEKAIYEIIFRKKKVIYEKFFTTSFRATTHVYIYFGYTCVPLFGICLLSGSHENPELIWNDDAREKVSETVKRMKLQ